MGMLLKEEMMPSEAGFIPCQTITGDSQKAKHFNYEISILGDKMTHHQEIFLK